MKESISRLIRHNEAWAGKKMAADPDFFMRSAQGQSPKFLWIGCSDSRVPPDDITQTEPGELFVHRNIANLVVENDINLLSVLQYAVEVLQVEDIIVCGHYGCGGVHAAMRGAPLGLIDQWLAPIKEAHQYYAWELEHYPTEEEKARKLVELNVLEQINNLGKTDIIRNAWKKGYRPSLNGWVYDLATGKLNILHEEIINAEQLKLACKFERKMKYDQSLGQ
jgi:carbonic anhydrase